MRILLIGATGQLGSDLVKSNPGHQIVAPGKTDLDVTRGEAVVAAVRDARADWIINTAAFHNVPLCEEHPDHAFRVNCVAVRDLAHACQTFKSRLLTFSTDYVFNGKKREPYGEDECPAPLQIYGISKLAGEAAALATAPEETVIVRTCGLYGQSGAASKGGNFVDNRIKDGHREAAIEISCDQTVCPTSTHDLSRAIYDLIANPACESGIYHLVNEGECTWFEFTKAIYEFVGITTQVHPVDRGGRSGTKRRPLYSVLANTRARQLGITLPSWGEALKRYLEAKYPDLIKTLPH